MEINEDEFAHYGVKGMKWGVRRAEKKKAKYQKKLDEMRKDYNDEADELSSLGKSLSKKLDKDARQLKEDGYDDDEINAYVKTGKREIDKLFSDAAFTRQAAKDLDIDSAKRALRAERNEKILRGVFYAGVVGLGALAVAGEMKSRR